MNFSVFDYCSDLCWVVNDKLEIVYANPSYSSLIENFTGSVLKTGDSVFIAEFGEEYLSKWSFIYKKVFSGQLKEVEESFIDPSTGKKIFGIIKFDLISDHKGYGDLAFCRNTDVTNFVSLRKEEKKLFEASMDVICSIDSDGNFVKVNAASKDLWGYEPEELEGTPYSDLIYPEDIEKTSKVAEEILSGKKITTFENRYIRKDGKIAYNFWSARWDEQDKMMYCVARDGKEKVENELLIHPNELRFKALVQEGSDLIAILDQEGNYKYVSPTSSSILGIEPHEFENRNAFEFIHPEDKERTMGFLNRIFEEQRVQVDPFRFQNNNGEWRWIETILTNMLDNQVVKGIVANSRDITEKVIEEQRLKLLENAINNTNDAILITEAEPMEEPGPRIVYANRAFLDATEYTLEEIIGQNPRILQGPKSDFEGLAEFGQKIRNWKPAEVTTVNYTKYGKEFWVNFSVSPVANHTGMFTHWVSIQKDVTEKKNIELKKELDSRINKIFRDKKSLKTALNGVCEELIEFLELEYTEFWLPTVSGDKLRRIASCFGSKSGEIFWKESKVYEQFNPNEGLPGEVWKKQKPISWKNISKDERFIRRKEAEKSGINSMAGIPIFHKGEISGVLLFGTEKPMSELEAIFPVLNSLQGSLGIDLDKKKLENEVNLTFQSAPDLIALLDLSGNFLKINATGSRLLSTSEEEIRGRNLNEFSNISEPDYFISSVKEKDNFKFKTRQILKDKTIKWLSWSCEVQRDEGLVFATAKDITSEKQMAELLNEASAVSRVGGWEVDLMSNKIYWSKIIHEIHETDPDSFIPKLDTAINFYRSDFRDLVKEKVDRAIQFGEPFDIEAILITANQKEIWVRSRGQAEFIDDTCVRLYGSFQDINEKKLTELRLKSLSDDLPGVTFQYYISPDGKDKLTMVSQGSYQIWGLSPEECMKDNGKVWSQIANGGDLEDVIADIQNSVQNLSKWNSRWRNVMPSGELRWHEGFGTPYKLPDGTVVFNSMIFDITEERNATLLYEKTAQLAKIGSWELEISENGEIKMYWSPVTRQILEMEPEEEISLSFALSLHKEPSRTIIQEAMQELMETGKPLDLELNLETAKGNDKWVRCIGNAELREGRVSRIFGSFQDIHERKILELRIREVLASISDAFYAIDANWNFIYFNKEAENLLARKSEDVMGKNIWEEFPAAKGTQLEEIYLSVVNQNESKSFEYFYPGNNCWYEINAYPSNGGLSVYFKNIDERIKAKERLESAYQEKEDILESIGDAFLAVNHQGQITYWNKRAEKLFGRKRASILGKDIQEIFGGSFKLILEYLDKALISNSFIQFEEYFEKKKKWVEGSIYPSDLGLSVYLKDITTRKETDLRLLQANERFEKVTEAATDAIWDWDMVKDKFYRGKGFEKLYGIHVKREFSQEDFWKDNFHPEDLEGVKESLKKALGNPKTSKWQYEYRIIHSSGKVINVLDKGIIIRDEDKNPIRMVGAMTDITYRKEFEEKLVKLNDSLRQNVKELEVAYEELEQFTFIASHDLQEPLRMINSFLQLLKRKYEPVLDEKGLQYIHFASDGAVRMKQIILDLLEYSRAGKFNESPEKVDLNQVINDFKILRRKVIEEKGVKLHFEKLPEINVYKTPFIQVIHNLLDNAIKYTKREKKPEVKIIVEETNENWLIKVQDNGIGIKEKYFDKIFTIFQRLHDRSEFTGTGIGLSIVKKNVESWGGNVWVESELDKGTTFGFSIPKTIMI